MAAKKYTVPDEMLVHLLQQSGFLPLKGTIDAAKIRNAVKDYQLFHGLKSDGVAGPRTERHLRQIRYCDHPDRMDFVSKGCWDRSRSMDLKWGVSGSVTGISLDDFKATYQASWDEWKKHANIHATYTKNIKTANIIVAGEKMDGKQGTLGQSYLPPEMDFWGVENTALGQQYDTDELWNQQGQVKLLPVMIHENGHVWGSPHLKSGAIMQPYYSSSIVTPQAADIAEVSELYGPPAINPNPDPSPVDPELSTVTIEFTGYAIRARVVG